MFKQVEGHSNLVRDNKTNAILNVDDDAYNQALLASKSRERIREELRSNSIEINNMKSEISEIKTMLKRILEKING